MLGQDFGIGHQAPYSTKVHLLFVSCCSVCRSTVGSQPSSLPACPSHQQTAISRARADDTPLLNALDAKATDTRSEHQKPRQFYRPSLPSNNLTCSSYFHESTGR